MADAGGGPAGGTGSQRVAGLDGDLRDMVPTVGRGGTSSPWMDRGPGALGLRLSTLDSQHATPLSAV